MDDDDDEVKELSLSSPPFSSHKSAVASTGGRVKRAEEGSKALTPISSSLTPL